MEVLPVSKDVLAGMPHSLDTGALRQNTQKNSSQISVWKKKIYKRKYNKNILYCTTFIFNRKKCFGYLDVCYDRVLMRFPL
jgi:hypothetical protein